MRVQLYSDGSSRGNPGPGGYGCILRAVDAQGNAHEKELSQGYRLTTNNRMELMGVIAGLEALRYPCGVEVITDSQYVSRAINEHWLENWMQRGWKTAGKKPVKNVDLWQRLNNLLHTHSVTFTWVRGHAGHAENERCDALATAAADGLELLEDSGFSPDQA